MNIRLNETTKEERELIYQIASRAADLAKMELGFTYPLLDAEMDVTAVHLNGNPLKLKELLQADKHNFAHDVFGIYRHIDRGTGQLTGHFMPRYTDTEKLEE